MTTWVVFINTERKAIWFNITLLQFPYDSALCHSNLSPDLSKVPLLLGSYDMVVVFNNPICFEAIYIKHIIVTSTINSNCDQCSIVSFLLREKAKSIAAYMFSLRPLMYHVPSSCLSRFLS